MKMQEIPSRCNQTLSFVANLSLQPTLSPLLFFLYPQPTATNCSVEEPSSREKSFITSQSVYKRG